jgi:hypothetical protein
LRNAADKVDDLRTAEGTPLPDTRAKLRRNLRWLRLLREQIDEVEHERLRQLAPVSTVEGGSRAMVRLLARVQHEAGTSPHARPHCRVPARANNSARSIDEAALYSSTTSSAQPLILLCGS